MQENGRMNWLEQVHQMKDRDIRTIEQHELQKLEPQEIETDVMKLLGMKGLISRLKLEKLKKLEMKL